MRKKLIFSLLLAVLLAAVTYTWNSMRIRPPSPQSAEEKQMTENLFEQTKTQCIGRYLFTVPASFENTLNNRVEINDMRITSERLYRPVFEQRIRLREQALKRGHTVNPTDAPFLKQVYPLHNMDGVIFDRNRNESVPAFGRTLEGHLYSDGVSFTVTADIRDLSDGRFMEVRERYLRTGTLPDQLNTKPQKLAEMQDLLTRLSGRQNDDVPAGPGSCIAQGFIRDGGGKPREDITLVYPHNNNFSLSVSTNNYLGDSTSMLERRAELQPYVYKANGRTLRKGKTRIAGVDTDEWLIIAHPEDEQGAPFTQLMFLAINNEKTVAFQNPILDLTLSNHALPTPTYSDAQLVDIWDRITRSFRFRPGAF